MSTEVQFLTSRFKSLQSSPSVLTGKGIQVEIVNFLNQLESIVVFQLKCYKRRVSLSLCLIMWWEQLQPQAQLFGTIAKAST